MQPTEGSQLENALRLGAGRIGFEAVVPNPKPKLLGQVREVMRLLLPAMSASHNPLFHPPGLLPMCQLPALSGAPRGHPGILSQTEPSWHSGVMEETKACE